LEFLDRDIQRYAEAHSTDEPAHLANIRRHTHLKVMMPRMLSGHLQGRILATFSQMLQPHRILEIGTYTGYSALCLAEGLKPGGTLITIDVNKELEATVRSHFKQAPKGNQIDFRLGNAHDIVPQLPGPFDLVFIDADKAAYSKYYNMVIGKVRQGGYIVADNVLWDAKVLQKTGTKIDKNTQALIDFNDAVQADPRVENVLFPVRDGLMVIRKV